MALSKILNASVTDSTLTTTKLATPNLGRRNLIINGAMNVAQRGTSFTLENNSIKYVVDRFFIQDTNSASGEATVSQSTTAPTDFKNSLKIDVTTADTALAAADQYKIEHRIEGQDIERFNYGTSSAKTVTLSFHIRSNKTGNTQVALLNSANDRSYIATFTIDSANTWERKELTIPGVTDGTWLNDNQTGLRLRWGSYGSNYQTSTLNQWISDSSAYVSQANSRNDSPINFFDSTDNELYLTGIQLEVGSQATPFEHRSFGEELALCQRFYYHHVGGSGANKFVCIGDFYTTAQCNAGISFPVAMRSAPSLVANSGSNYWLAYQKSAGFFSAGAWTIFGATTNATSCYNQSFSGATTGGSCRVMAHDASAYMAFDAEL